MLYLIVWLDYLSVDYPKFKDHQPPRSPTVARILAPSEGFRQQPEDLQNFMKESSEDFWTLFCKELQIFQKVVWRSTSNPQIA